jgi:toxin CptA
MTSAPAIGFEYQPFRRLLIFVGVLVALSVALSALAPWLKWALLAGVLLAIGRSARSTMDSPVVAAGWSADNSWTLHLASHEDVPATLASFRVLGQFVLLRPLMTGQGVQVLLLAPGNSDADTRRRLYMRLATIQPGEAVPRL